MIVNAVPPALQVETFLLSCRALGKGIEHQMAAKLGAIARDHQLDTVEFHFVPTEKNLPAREFLRELCQTPAEIFADECRVAIGAHAAATVEYKPTSEHQDYVNTNEGIVHPKSAESRGDVDSRLWLSIVEQFQTGDEIHKAVIDFSRRHVGERTSYVPPATPLESKVAEIWSDILGIERVGANDRFFDLGGHSLLAMQVLARIADTLNVELSPSILYLGEFTVSGLSKAILVEQIGQAGVGDLQTIFEKLDGMDTDQIHALLSKEDLKDRF
jgi:acyl carrier protein